MKNKSRELQTRLLTRQYWSTYKEVLENLFSIFSIPYVSVDVSRYRSATANRFMNFCNPRRRERREQRTCFILPRPIIN